MKPNLAEIERMILHYFNLPTVKASTKYEIKSSVESQIEEQYKKKPNIKMEDIVIALSNLEDQNKLEITYYEIMKAKGV